MDIEIDDRRAPEQPVPETAKNSNCEVIEDAEARTLGSKCVMRSAGEIAAPAHRKCIAQCTKGPADGRQCASDKILRRRKTNAAHYFWIERSGDAVRHILAIMSRFNR